MNSNNVNGSVVTQFNLYFLWRDIERDKINFLIYRKHDHFKLDETDILSCDPILAKQGNRSHAPLFIVVLFLYFTPFTETES